MMATTVSSCARPTKPSRRETRAKRPRVKEQLVKEREYLNQRLVREEVAELEQRPRKCTRPYRFLVLRETIVEERTQRCLGVTHRYFFYVTNDRE